jgi:intracellular sulfur oxidation DsrE/DsrF family protein
MLRRSFLSHVTGLSALAGVARPAAPAFDQSASGFSAARHPQDDWLDQVPGKHRVVFDTWFADRFSEPLAFANNIFRVNKDAYGLTDADLAVIIVVRHGSAPYAFNDEIWKKYGDLFAKNMSVSRQEVRPLPATNPYAQRLANLGKEGMQLAVCNLSTRNYCTMIAKEHGTEADAVYKELTTNTVGPAHFVPAGVVAVTRAQEHGYVLVSNG